MLGKVTLIFGGEGTDHLYMQCEAERVGLPLCDPGEGRGSSSIPRITQSTSFTLIERIGIMRFSTLRGTQLQTGRSIRRTGRRQVTVEAKIVQRPDGKRYLKGKCYVVKDVSNAAQNPQPSPPLFSSHLVDCVAFFWHSSFANESRISNCIEHWSINPEKSLGGTPISDVRPSPHPDGAHTILFIPLSLLCRTLTRIRSSRRST